EDRRDGSSAGRGAEQGCPQARARGRSAPADRADADGPHRRLRGERAAGRADGARGDRGRDRVHAVRDGGDGGAGRRRAGAGADRGVRAARGATCGGADRLAADMTPRGWGRAMSVGEVKPERADYGIDAPHVVRNMALIGATGLALALVALFVLW